MAKITYRIILVVGDNHQEIVKKYSADTKVKEYIKFKFDESAKKQSEHIKLIETLLTDDRVKLDQFQYKTYKDLYLSLKKMNNKEYFDMISEGLELDENHNALTTENPNAFYKYEHTQQKRLEITGEEGDFSDPFPLKDGTKSYSAHFNDIDWGKIHRNKEKMQMHNRVWELVMEDAEPQTEQEVSIKRRMQTDSMMYFQNNFKTKEDFVNYSSNLWYWGIATEEKYEEVDYKISDMEWVIGFYDKYIKPLEKTNPLITIYETHSLD